jgi:hypothetical protein
MDQQPQTPSWGSAPGARPASTNGLAIASLVLGILWIYRVGSVLALIAVVAVLTAVASSA